MLEVNQKDSVIDLREVVPVSSDSSDIDTDDDHRTIIMLLRMPTINADVKNNGLRVARARSAKKKSIGGSTE